MKITHEGITLEWSSVGGGEIQALLDSRPTWRVSLTKVKGEAQLWEAKPLGKFAHIYRSQFGTDRLNAILKAHAEMNAATAG